MASEAGGPKRFLAKHKVQAVLRLLGGEDIEHLSRELSVTAATLSEWRDTFLGAGETGLKPRPAKESVEVDRLQSKIGEQARHSSPPWPSRLLHGRGTGGRIKAALAESPFTGEGYRKVWAMLRDKDVRTSKERTLRLMRENGLLAVKRPGRPHGPKAHNGTIRTRRVDEMWGTDMTSTMTFAEGNAAIFFAIDHCSLELVGIHAARRGTRFEALEPIRQGVRHSFGAFGKDVAAGLTLRHDHGSQFISEDFQREMAFLGIKDSPSYVREPQGNGIAERFVRILKENLLWIRRFQTVEDLRQGLLAFKEIYNRQ